MPFLNAERFIAEAIESVVAQQFQSWELLVVDDGSSDGSSAIARRYANSDDRIRYLTWPDNSTRGASAARNLALKNARGDFIAFLDADDVWLPGHLDALVPVLDARPEAGSAYSNTLFWYSWDGSADSLGRDYMPRLGFRSNNLIDGPELIVACWRGLAAVPCTCGLLVRRRVVEEIGGFEEQFRSVFTDQAFYTKLFLAAPAIVVAGCWSWYRQHADSSCAVSERSGRHRERQAAYLQWSLDYLQSLPVPNAAAANALRQELRWHRWPILLRWRDRSVSARRAVGRLAGRLVKHLGPAADRLASVHVPIGQLHFGPLHDLEPVSREYGLDRGLPVDRYYIENFLSRCSTDIRGNVLEVGDNVYTRRFGGSRVTTSDILHVNRDNPRATIVADLSSGDGLPDERFDCVIVTQTLHLIYDMPAAVRTLQRILKPGGVCLVTVPGISQLETGEWNSSWYWSLTELSARRLFGDVFGASNVRVESRGNVLAACAFLQGLSREELRQEELDHNDPLYPVSVLVRAIRGGDATGDR